MKKKSVINKRKRELVDVESKLRRLESVIYDPNVISWMQRGGLKGIREQLLRVDYNVIRNVVDKVPLLNAIVKTRVNQVLSFAEYVSEDLARDGEKGFRIIPQHENCIDKEELAQIREFIEQTGVVYSPDREDDFSDYLQMFVREVGTIDQVATELQYNLAGDVVAFRLLDGATIKRTLDYEKKHVTFVQVVDDKVVEEFNENNLIFDYKNKRVDLRFRGYGYSDIEMAIDLITTLLFGYNHLRDQFVRDKIPRGFIAVMGDIDQKGIQAIQQYWYSAMSGAGGQWAIPILPSGRDGVGLDFKAIGHSNKEMEYHRGMMFLSSIICAVFAIDMAELGIKAEDSASVIGSNEFGPRIRASKDRGLESLLMFISQHVNKILRKTRWSGKYRFAFTGHQEYDQLKHTQILQARLTTDLTINDILRKQGKPAREEEWANVVLNPHVVQLILAGKQQGAMGVQGEAIPGGEAPPEQEEPQEGEETWLRRLFPESESESEPTQKSIIDRTWDTWRRVFEKHSRHG